MGVALEDVACRDCEGALARVDKEDGATVLHQRGGFAASMPKQRRRAVHGHAEADLVQALFNSFSDLVVRTGNVALFQQNPPDGATPSDRREDPYQIRDAVRMPMVILERQAGHGVM